jgi:predicted ATPase/DNA-binding winged helix-turn-helix (wHTH) protein
MIQGGEKGGAVRYLFGNYILDTQRHELHLAGEPIKLRRKVFQVLTYLLTHRDRVVPKQELLEHLWPDQFVGDEALKSCIKILRRALGERGRAPHFVRTLHGQGYRFVAPVEVREPLPADGTAPSSCSPPSAGRSTVPPFGREQELTCLHGWLTQARRGVRQMVFVTGEAGLGKTTLVETFVAELGDHGPLWIGHGQCVEHYGVGEAYLPVLEALGCLCRGPGGQELVALLGQQAPTWLVQMPGLIPAADLETLRRRIGGATRERMLRELAEALELLTAQQPLLLVLEDLQWSDPSTLDLLAVLARRREPACLLLIATYRPPEVQRRAHPLHTIQQELQLHGHSVELPLTLLTEEAVATYLACRLPGLPRVDRLARLVHQRTEGNPLFMVALVDSWLTQGVLLEHDGVWALAAMVEALHNSVPDSLRQMIDRQLDGLSAEEERMLEAASVAGVAFSAAGVAAGLAQEVESVDDWCTSLARRGQFLRTSGEQLWPDGTVAGAYRFVHALYQQVLYQRVSAAQRVRLHQRIGARLEAGHGAQAGAMSAELAMHFVRGRDAHRAVQYLRQAGQRSMERSAYVEAVGHLTRGLEVLKTRPATPERTQHELTLHIALGAALQILKGNAAPEVEHAYTQARVLCQQVGETPELAAVLFGLFRFYMGRLQLHTARELGETLLRLAQSAHDSTLAVIAHYANGWMWFVLGALPAARQHLEEGIALYTPDQRRALVSCMGEDLGIGCRTYAALTLWLLGYPAQALAHLHEALALAHGLSQPYILAWMRSMTARFYQGLRDVPAVYEHADAIVALSTEQGFSFWAAVGTSLRGWALAMQGQGAEGMAQIRQGAAAMRATGAAVFVLYFCTLLADVCDHLGHTEDGLQALAEAHTILEQHEERWWEAEVHRLRGVLLLRQTMPQQEEAEAWLQRALDVARRQEAKVLELRAAMSLARLWQQQGKRDAASQLLEEVYGWFTEGFDTTDLQEARILLEELRV